MKEMLYRGKPEIMDSLILSEIVNFKKSANPSFRIFLYWRALSTLGGNPDIKVWWDMVHGAGTLAGGCLLFSRSRFGRCIF
jgi:hypothetical protein